MTESMLQSLMKLFAILATINVDATRIFSKNFVESYLKGQFSPKMVEKSVSIFEEYLEQLAYLEKHESEKRITILSVKILMICDEINRELNLKSKFLILFSIIQFSKHFEAHSVSIEEFRSTILDAVNTISEALLINESEYNNCKSFINDRFYKVPDRDALLVVSAMESIQFSDIRHFYKKGLEGQLFFLKITQADLYIFYYSGKAILEIAGKNIFPNHIYVFPKGAAIKAENMTPLYYGDIVSVYHKGTSYPSINFIADSIEFTYPKSDNGVHKMNLEFNSGELIGVLGGSGAGKSTLMGVLNGNIVPDSGRILINGGELNEDDKAFDGILGFVPQDDLLIEELTVFENLYYNAKLCLGQYSEHDIIKIIGKVLNNLGLFYIKDLKVGSPLNKFISGGQRKRLNIALELIREPYVLFVDEPTSGLSSTDSENVLLLLKEQSLSGKIVVLNIHQPSSEMFKLFDKIIIMDKGGYPVYFGNPLESVHYLKNVARRADAEEIQCETCGNVQTDEILKIIEAKKVNEFGEYTRDRLFNPQDWYKLYKENIEKPVGKVKIEKLPDLNFKIPSRIRQFWIYTKRNFVSKLADKQFVLLSLLITPILAFILGFFTKYLGGSDAGNPSYIFSLNDNLPAYLFMSVIVSLFVGMIISAEEIIRDRKIRTREAFLNLNKYSYFNSKIIFLLGLSAFQMFVFILIGNLILDIKGLNVSYWLILFSTSCFAVLLGLNISAGLKSIISIYIIIPFILVPLILLSGVIVKYDKLHPTVAGQEYVPIVGDLMASRWAYEALVVNQFKNNNYEKHFFEKEKEQANTLYLANFLVPELFNKIEDLKQSMQSGNTKKTDRIIKILSNTFPKLEGVPEELKLIDPVDPQVELMQEFLRQWKAFLIGKSDVFVNELDEEFEDFSRLLGSTDLLVKLKQDFHNEAIEDLALNSNDFNKIIEFKSRLIRKDTPVFQEPESHFGRAQFFAASKFIGELEIDTIWFNIMVLWIMTLILYIALVNDWLRKIISILS